MSTDWICFICNAKNSVDNRYCTSCGAQRPFAAQSFAAPENSDSLDSSEEDSAVTSEETIILEKIERLAQQVIIEDIEIEQFNAEISSAFNEFEEIISRLAAEINSEENPEIAKKLDTRLKDANYIMRLAQMQFEMYDLDNKKAAGAGMLLAELSHEGISWVAEYLRNKKDPEIADKQNIIGRAVVGFMNGEIDSDTYFDMICSADDTLTELMQEGHRIYFSALEDALKFDGTNYKTIIPAKKGVEKAVEKWIKAIAAVSLQ